MTLIQDLIKCNIFKIGNFKLKSGSFSPIYIDLRQIINYPHIVRDLAHAIRTKQLDENIKADVICGVPYTALPVASVFSVFFNVPMIMKRKEIKSHGTKKMIEGSINVGDSCLIIEDIVSSGTSVIETANALQKEGIIVQDCIVVVNRNQGGAENLDGKGIKLHQLFDINEIFETYCSMYGIEEELVAKVKLYFKDNSYLAIKTTPNVVRDYLARSNLATHRTAKRLFDIMATKKTNLCVAVDTNSMSELLDFAKKLAPHICILKTHIDILNDFSPDLISELVSLADKNDFLILEDRKFADIGNTVKHQFYDGIYKIEKWANMITVHAIPGDGIIKALKSKDCSCVLIAEMSSKGSLTNDEYKESVFKMAEDNTDCVVGYVAQKSFSKGNFIHMCPGVNIEASGDSLGQQYITPEEAVSNGADVIIVGRGICKSEDSVASAIEYKTRGYNAYLKLAFS